MQMNLFFLIFIFLLLSLTQSCDVFVGMSCTCYESHDIRCTMSKYTPLKYSSTSLHRKFHSIDLKFESDDDIVLDAHTFQLLNDLLPQQTRSPLTITFRFQNFRSLHAKTASFSSLFQGISSASKRITIELHPVRAKSIVFDSNVFDNLKLNELSIYADSLTSSFESIFNNADIAHLNIEGAIVTHEPSLLKNFQGHIQSLKITRMIDTVNSDEFPPFPVKSYTIEAHKMRTLDAYSFRDYTQLTGLNIIQPDVLITPKILNGLENLVNLRSLSIDAERITEGAFNHVKQIHTLILGSYLKILDIDNLNSLKSLKQLDVRYVQFSTLQGKTSCALADYINRRRMLGLTAYVPDENPECDCVLVFLNNMVGDGSQLNKCQSTNNDRCLFSSCPIVSEYFTRKQKEDQDEQPTQPIQRPIQPTPAGVDFDNEGDSPFYPHGNLPDEQITTTTTTKDVFYDNDDNINEEDNRPPSSNVNQPDYNENDFSAPAMKRLHPDAKDYPSNKYLVISWIPFAIAAACLFLSLVIAMVAYVIYHKRRTASFKRVPQTVPII